MRNVPHFISFRIISILAAALVIPYLLGGCTFPPGNNNLPPKNSGDKPSSRKEQKVEKIQKDLLLQPQSMASLEKTERRPIRLHAAPPAIESKARPTVAEETALPGILDFPKYKNREVKKYIKYFQYRRHGTFRKWMERYGKYGPMMRQILREYGLPEDLVFTSLVESGLSPYAYSRAKATGPWQFISSTGKHYGLRINWWIDERRDPVKSTHAAASYLRDLYKKFNSWPLALAGYNAGENRVMNAIRRTGTTDFWRIARTRYLKLETREYVPKIIATSIIANNPGKYGFEDIAYQTPLVYEQVKIDLPTNTRIIAKSAGVTYSMIKALNPELKRGVTPPNYPNYMLKVPSGSRTTFLANYKKALQKRQTGWRRHRVHKGESLWHIARLYGSSMNAIAELNKLDNPHRIKVGDNLLIPTKAPGNNRMILAHADGNSSVSVKGVRTFSYLIRPGDNLSDISSEFGVPLDDILRVNKLTDPHLIYAGKAIRLPVFEGSSQSKSFTDNASSNGRESQVAGVELVKHKIRRGETLSNIALSYGVDIKKIARANNISNINRLRKGNTITIPIVLPNGFAQSVLDSSGKSSKGIVAHKGVLYRKLFHTVRRGDTLWEISRTFDVSLKELRLWNKLYGNRHIYPGDILQILIAQR